MKPQSRGTFATCSVDCTVKVWDLRNKKDAALVHTLEGHAGYVTTIQWVPDGGDRLVSGSFDFTVKIWDTRRGEMLHSLEKHRDAVTRFDISHENAFLVTAGQDGDVNFWGVDDGRFINCYEAAGRILQVAWNKTDDKAGGIVFVLAS